MAIFPIASDKVQLSSVAPAVTDTVNRAILRDAGNTVARAALVGGVQYADGLLFTALGQVVYVDATAGLPVASQYANGIPLAATGEMCISTDATATWANGLPFTANGALSAVVA